MPCGCFGSKKRVKNAGSEPGETKNVAKVQEKPSPNANGRPQSQSKGNASTEETPDPHGNIQFIEDAITAHNEKRKLHGCEPLVHAEDLTKFSQKYAEYLVNNDKFEHSKREDRGTNVGENLAWASGKDLTGQSTTDMWYNEIKDYNFSKQGFTMGTGHFTQVVWKGTKEIGIGKATNPATGSVIVCANYRPAGNMQGSFEENVLPLH